MAKQRKFVDNIPKYRQQRRSPAPKRRTDFSLFSYYSPSSSLPSSESLPGSSCDSHRSSNITLTSTDDKKHEGKSFHQLHLALHGNFQDEKFGLSTSLLEVPATKVESVAQDVLLNSCSQRDLIKQKTDTSRILNFASTESQVKGNGGVCMTPGNVVWAKTACQMWWPAEIVEGESTSAGSETEGISGHVLVQFYGKHESAWVDPEKDLSPLEKSFEERSCNHMENFQDGLEQALKKKEHLLCQRQLLFKPDGSNCLLQQDQSSRKSVSSNSGKVEGDLPKKVREKRERKPKIHFDEVALPCRSAKKVRRFKIMRHLGLAAPLGSPF
ncbi:hypothetical protein HS088_TW03G00777 [Tripterygium wilfordii]|uniref:PWWP domain-containing protein n=1 Tax=Tripterygium wilfordii TaxID=458696 RepID=A0A7J7DVW0_TRIWF|nr:uncharacterized protein LOC119989426 [Tripterygium wilfordii]KAF5750441.1 hypothetical protein HS088_TW03G00777 [Tripterygium wilfordii]